MTSVLKISQLFTALIILTSFLVIRPHVDFRDGHSGIKVEKFASAIKIEKKNKFSVVQFWIPVRQSFEVLVANDVIFSQTVVSAIVHVFLGYTARPPPEFLA